MRTLTFLLTLLMATALQAQPLLDEASSTLQPALQQLGRRLLRHKTGSIVAIQPATGRVLCLVTHSPEGEKPALALATPYPPASTMKTAEALMLYSEGLIDDETTVACHGALRTGNIRVHCHSHASPLRLTNALAYSCNTWFLSTFLRMMGDRDRYETKDSAITVWNRYMRSMGLGGPTGIDMEGEKGRSAGQCPLSQPPLRRPLERPDRHVDRDGAGRRHRHAPPALRPGFLHRQPWLVVPSPSPRLRPRPSALRALRHAPFHQGHPCRLCRRHPGHAPGRPPRYADGRRRPPPTPSVARPARPRPRAATIPPSSDSPPWTILPSPSASISSMAVLVPTRQRPSPPSSSSSTSRAIFPPPPSAKPASWRPSPTDRNLKIDNCIIIRYIFVNSLVEARLYRRVACFYTSVNTLE